MDMVLRFVLATAVIVAVDPPCPRPRVLAILYSHDSVHHDVGYSPRVTPWLFVRRKVFDGFGVEHRDVCRVARPYEPSVSYTVYLGGVACHAPHRVLQPEHAFSDILAEHPREGAVGPGMGFP